MVFTLKCPMPGCGGQLTADTKEDLLKQATDHAKTAHGMPMIPPNVMSQLQAAIKQTWYESVGPVFLSSLSFLKLRLHHQALRLSELG